MKTQHLGIRYYKCIISIAIVILISSCKSLYYTRFVNDNISIGTTKELIIKTYGKPYSENIEYNDGKKLEIVQYKELMAYGYVLNTYFYFEDGKFLKKIQKEERPSEVVVEQKQ